MGTCRKTLQQRLAARRLKSPPAAIYLILANVIRVLFVRRLGVSFTYRVNPKDYKGPYIVVSNHASRVDYVYTALAFLPHRLNFVAGYNEFFRSHLAFIFRLMQVIPKKNFTPDTYTIREFIRIIKGGGRVIIFPEGMSSISGSNQPVAVGSGKLLKHFGVPVLMTRISGGYLTNTKYCLDERRGRVDVTVDRLFTPEELARLSVREIEDRLNEAIANDDYAWNRTARVRYSGGGNLAKGLHHLLYWCPRCGGEFTMRGEGNVIRCTRCGNGATLNEYYDLVPLDGSCVIPETPRVWFDLERERIRRKIRERGFELRERVRLGILPRYRYLKDQDTSEIAGSGELVLNGDGFTYTGTKEGAPFSFHLSPRELPTYGMCTDVTRFYTFFAGEFYEFYPAGESVGKWFHATEELHRLCGGKWRDFPQPPTGVPATRTGMNMAAKA